jgi:hypothetical protein
MVGMKFYARFFLVTMRSDKKVEKDRVFRNAPEASPHRDQ